MGLSEFEPQDASRFSVPEPQDLITLSSAELQPLSNVGASARISVIAHRSLLIAEAQPRGKLCCLMI